MGIGYFIKKNKFKKRWVYILYVAAYKVKMFLKFGLRSNRKILSKRYQYVFGRKIDLKNPHTLNEKIQWLKLYDHKDLYTVCADKYAVRKYLSDMFGEEYLIPLLLHTSNPNEINLNNITTFPCIIKANHTSGDYVILRKPQNVNWKELQFMCRFWLSKNYYLESQEWQYKNIKRQIVVEKLLQTKEGKIPNDYKLHYINGTLMFVYVSIDREGVNKRNIYDAEWKPLPFSWVSRETTENVKGKDICQPSTFEKMKEIGGVIAKNFKYVRVDFYDVDGHLYFGEITLHHGSGFDIFSPDEYDFIYGDLLKL